MQCAKLHLQERSKSRTKSEKFPTTEKTRRYCQKRMVNPEHEEDPRWIDVFERFHCNVDSEQGGYNSDSDRACQGEDIFLSVQNLKFQGNVQERKRPRTCFKYKALTDGKQHRMFVKQIVDNQESDEDRSSQLTCYYFDDYVKYLLNTDRSRPSTGKSSIFLYGLNNKFKENKATQVDTKQNDVQTRKIRKVVSNADKRNVKKEQKEENKKTLLDSNMEDAKIAFHKSGKRKSLTISRTQSPETVQVIRVDVVCNYSTSSLSDNEESKKPDDTDDTKLTDKKIDNLRNSHFANKYLLTNTVKTLDENLSSGAKVTLLCKTFRLSDRSKVLPVKKSNANNNIHKEISKPIKNKS